MSKKSTFLIFLLLFTSGCLAKGNQPLIKFSNGAEAVIQIADDDKERQQGLMNISSLPKDAGLLFIWPNEGLRQFWMKNTLIPLDMIFISADKEVVNILKNVPPCQIDPCPLYPSSQPAQYVLEVNGGWTEEKTVKAGDRLEILNLKF